MSDSNLGTAQASSRGWADPRPTAAVAHHWWAKHPGTPADLVAAWRQTVASKGVGRRGTVPVEGEEASLADDAGCCAVALVSVR